MDSLVEPRWGGIIGSMDDLKKQAVGYRSGGFMQVRRGTRPLHVETLLRRKTPESAANIFEPARPTTTDKTFEQSLAATAGEEFQPAEAEEKVASISEREFLAKVKNEAAKEGFDIFAVAGRPDQNTGASIYSRKGPKDTSAAWNARKAHMEWEKSQGMDPAHDWSKTAELRRDKTTEKPTQVDPKVVESVKIKQLGTENGKKVFLVNGADIRNKIDTDFALGGNSARYSYVPEGELWVEQTGSTVDSDEKHTIKHEDREENLMRRGMNYNQAHGEATKVETVERRKQASAGEFVGRLAPLVDDAAILAWRAYQNKQGKKQEIQEPKVGEVKKSSLITDLEKEAAKETKLKTELQPYQQRVIDRLRNQSGLVVAHGLGSGKTLSSIAAATELAPGEAAALVPAALQENYLKEIAKHTEGASPVSVGSLQNAVVKKNIPSAPLLIVDEAHRLRNPAAEGYQLIRDAKTGKRMLLTGSPVYNKPEDIAPLVNLAAGGRVLPVGSDFNRRYVRQPGRGLLTLINPFASVDPKIVNKGELGGALHKWVDYYNPEGERSADYPSLKEVRIDVPMSEYQTTVHDAAWGQVPLLTQWRLRKSLPPNKQELSELNRFQSQARQIASSEKKFRTGDDPVAIAPKIQEAARRLSDQIETNPRHRGLVYANYLETLNDYAKTLDEKGIPYAQFRGDMSAKVRNQAVKDYNEGKIKALLVSGAGGEGLDLKGTRQVQVLEPHWNEEKLKQVIGRARRLGSHAHLPQEERNVLVENYSSYPQRSFLGAMFKGRKGVEGMLYDMSAQKQRLNDQVIDLMKSGQHRERIEVYGLHNGKLLAGRFPDRSVGVYGGGVDPGETHEQAAHREFLEESGYNIGNLRRVDVPPFESPWVEDHGPIELMAPKRREEYESRRKKFPSGHKTTYFAGEVSGEPSKPADDTGSLGRVRPIDLNRAIKIQQAVLSGMTNPYDIRRLESRIAVLESLKDPQKTAARRPEFPNGTVRENGMAKIAAEATTGRREFAPGIPTGRVVQRIPSVKESGPNAEWTASLALHPAAKRGDHYDLRLVDSKGKAHSWAINNIPEPGKSTYAAQMPTHSGSYAKRTEPFTIPINVYGGTRPGAQVEPKYVQPVEVISANDNRVHLLRHEGQKTEELVLRRVAMAGDQTPIWALHNATRTRSTQEGQRLPDMKPRYQEIPIGSVDFNNDQQLMTAKIDGAHTIVDFYKPDRMARTYSYRPTQRESGVIEHTFKFPNFQNLKTPPSLKGTMIRAETWASDSAGRAIPASEIGGLLNSNVIKSRQAQQEGNITLRRTGIDVIRYNGKDMSTAPYERKLEILREVNKATKGAIELPISARTPEEKAELLNAVKAGRLPETKEGVVLHDLSSSTMMKAKVRPDTDVYVREIVTKPLTEAKGQAAGFKYSLEPTGPIIGHVGTGFSTQLRKEMLESPDRFVGRVAKVQSGGQHVSRSGRIGALVGSPAFKEWHIDKTPPELMKEATSIGEVISRAEKEVDPEALAERLMETSRTVKALKPIVESSVVRPSLLKLRNEYRNIIGEKPGD